MTKDKALKHILRHHELYKLPRKFRTKSFVLECVYEYDISFITYEIERAGIQVDYDILLAMENREYKKYEFSLPINNTHEDFITDEEYAKLRTTILLLN